MVALSGATIHSLSGGAFFGAEWSRGYDDVDQAGGDVVDEAGHPDAGEAGLGP
jgi:hypothetical protein